MGVPQQPKQLQYPQEFLQLSIRGFREIREKAVVFFYAFTLEVSRLSSGTHNSIAKAAPNDDTTKIV